jgi:uncharacterized membrane protein
MSLTQSAPPPHIEQNLRAAEQLHVEYHESATATERLLERIKIGITQPLFVLIIAFAIVSWLAFNITLRNTYLAFDPPPFPYLDVALATFASLVTILILATQRRADRLAAHREQLILQLAMASEQKTAKIISLLEELRRDSPQVTDRTDKEAAEMSDAADPLAVSKALRNVEQGAVEDAKRQR